MQYSQEHFKTMVYPEFGGQTECIMGNWKIVNRQSNKEVFLSLEFVNILLQIEAKAGKNTSSLL